MGTNPQELGNVIECLLFVSDQPLSIKRIGEIIAATRNEIDNALTNLTKRLDENGSGLKVIRVAGGAQMVTRETYSPYMKKFFTTRKRTTLTRPALETLAIIAYKQPITRTEIELIRGVNADGVVSTLLERQLIEIKGRKDVPGLPLLYGTTKEFLIKFGLDTLNELPNQDELEAMFAAKEESTDTDTEGTQPNGDIIETDVRTSDVIRSNQGQREDDNPAGDKGTTDGQDRS